MATRADGISSWYTVAAECSSVDVADVIRAVLRALRDELDYFGIDATSDSPWPDDIRWAVDRLDEHRRSTKRRFFGWRPGRDVTAVLDLEDEADFEAALATVPYTIGCTGLNHRGQIVYSVNDTGTSATFRLTLPQVKAAQQALESSGGNPTGLIAMPQRP